MTVRFGVDRHRINRRMSRGDRLPTITIDHLSTRAVCPLYLYGTVAFFRRYGDD